MVLLGFGSILIGRYYLRLNPDAEEPAPPTSNFTRFLVNHRHQLKVMAQTGAALSVLGLIAECFGGEPTKRAWLPLLFGAFILDSFAKKVANPMVTDDRDWLRVPEWMRRALPIVQKALGLGQLLVAGVLLLRLGFHYSLVHTSAFRLGIRIFAYGLAASTYALQALFFKYGELRDESDLTVT